MQKQHDPHDMSSYGQCVALQKVLKHFAWIVGLYTLRIQVGAFPYTLQSQIIGDVLMLRVMLTLRRKGLYLVWPTIGIVLSLLHLTSRLAALIGLSQYYSIQFEMFSSICILFILVRVIHLIPRLKSYRSAVIGAFVSMGLSIAFMIATLLSLGLVLALHETLAQFRPISALSAFLGMIAPTMIMHFVATGLTVYAAISMARAVRPGDFIDRDNASGDPNLSPGLGDS